MKTTSAKGAKTQRQATGAAQDPRARANEVLAELQALGAPSIKKVLLNHGIPEPLFGVRVGDMKPIQKRIKTDYALALALYDTGNHDARYLAGLIADDARMTKADLQHWVDTANSGALASSTVPWVAAGSPHGFELAIAWIESDSELTAAAGWSTLSSIVSVREDTDLDLARLKALLARVRRSIHTSPNEVRSAMNGFVIAVGAWVAPLRDAALETAQAIGRVQVDVGKTSCQVPFAPERIRAAIERQPIVKKRKTAKC